MTAPYSEERWEAARKFAREHNSVVKLFKRIGSNV
jgi:hypothetical protein